ncbi:MAG: hypothetical protein BAJATHORv1_160003 [Candidatus Thorarchaeota archaeon]|nr:MAG: hypothetical protein BAJATHORv1_160003 [Candidatus Thorarchaeota archaeon]
MVKHFYQGYTEACSSLANAICGQVPDNFTLSRLILDRLIFLYFLSSGKFYPCEKQGSEHEIFGDNFYNSILVPFFFNSPRTIIQEDIPALDKSPLWISGIFTPKSEYELDSTGKPFNLMIDSKVWKTIFDFLDSFQWSLDELASGENVLTPQILGSLYEKVALNSSKNNYGSFYTPSWIAEHLSSQAIISLFKTKMRDRFGDANWQSWFEQLLDNSYDNLDKVEFFLMEVLLPLKVCDNACGSGAFLLAVLSFLERFYSASISILSDQSSFSRIQAAMGSESLTTFDIVRYIISENLFGVDIRAEALEATRIRLWLDLLSRNMVSQERLDDLPDLEKNLIRADSLLGSPLSVNQQAAQTSEFNWDLMYPEVYSDGAGFDIVLGNPPYYRLSTLSSDYRMILESLYTHINRESNAYTGFIESASNIIKSGGMVGYVIHKNFFNLDSYSSLRRYLVENMTLVSLVDLGKRIFVGVTAETVLLIFENSPPSEENLISLYKRVNESETIRLLGFITQNQFLKEISKWNHRFMVHLDSHNATLLENIRANSTPLSDLCDISRGIETGDNSQYLSDVQIDPSWKPIMRGRDIGRYILHDYVFIKYLPDELTGPRDPKMLEQEKLVTQQNSAAPTLYYDSGQHLVLNSATVIRSKQQEIDLKVILIILNSSLFNWLFRTVMTNWSTLTTNILPTNLACLPIKEPEDAFSWKTLAEYLLFLSSKREISSEIDALFVFFDKIADGMVESLYLNNNPGLPDRVRDTILPIDNITSDLEKIQKIITTMNRLQEFPLSLMFNQRA